MNGPKGSLPELFGDRLSIRIVGIDTPEMKGKCDHERMMALQAKAFLVKHLEQAQDIHIELIARDKYFRVLSLIVADGLDLADEMVKAGLAYAYDGGTKDLWCTRVPVPGPGPEAIPLAAP
jgi:endonuclease YncB( thermonuclease family)